MKANFRSYESWTIVYAHSLKICLCPYRLINHGATCDIICATAQKKCEAPK